MMSRQGGRPRLRRGAVTREREETVIKRRSRGKYQRLAVGRPCLGEMLRQRLRRREALSRSRSVGPLRENAAVAVAIGLERDAAPIRCPDRVRVASAEGQAGRGSSTLQVISPDDGVVSIIGLDGQFIAV